MLLYKTYYFIENIAEIVIYRGKFMYSGGKNEVC